jgi:hypothetical protein
MLRAAFSASCRLRHRITSSQDPSSCLVSQAASAAGKARCSAWIISARSEISAASSSGRTVNAASSNVSAIGTSSSCNWLC